jgi:hypothetical protein
MKKLELKHLTPYLSYGINCKISESDQNYDMPKNGDNIKLNTALLHHSITLNQFILSPILRPLSDLMKSTWINKFYLEFGGGYKNLTQYRHKNLDNFLYSAYTSLPYKIVNKMFELHFDVFGLIEKELAIDINTL